MPDLYRRGLNSQHIRTDLCEHRFMPLPHGRGSDVQLDTGVRLEKETRVLLWPDAATCHETCNADAVIPTIRIAALRPPLLFPIDFFKSTFKRRMKVPRVVDGFALS